MRILYLCSDLGIPVHGHKGAAVHVRELSQALRDLGHQVLILSPRTEGGPPEGFLVPVHEIQPAPYEQLIYELMRHDPRIAEPMAKELRSLLYAACLGHRSLGAARRFSPDVIYERYSLFGTAGVTLARSLRVPLILEVNAPLSREQAAYRHLTLGTTAAGVERDVVNAADRVIVVSDELERWLTGLGVEPGRITVMPNAVDVDRFEHGLAERASTREKLGVTTAQVVGFVGTLKPWHDTETLLSAVAICRRRGLSTHLLVVGDGPQRRRLEELARWEGIADATTFVGTVPHDRVPALVAAMDVAVAPYRPATDFYFSPLKLYEYMAAQRPVIAAAVGRLGDCVRHGESGWLYPAGDVGALSDAIMALVTDTSRAASLGHAGQRHVRARHSWSGNARAVTGLVESTLARQGA